METADDWTPGVQGSGGVYVEIDSLAADAYVIVRLSTTHVYPGWEVHLPTSENFGRQSETLCGTTAPGLLLGRPPQMGDPHGSYYFSGRCTTIAHINNHIIPIKNLRMPNIAHSSAV